MASRGKCDCGHRSGIYITVTPLQLATMTARLANGGRAVHPTLTRVAVDAQNRLVPVEAASSLDMGIPQAHLNIIQQGMWEAVNVQGGTAQRAALSAELGEMAGKTGTAQVRRITRAEREMGVIRNEDLPWERRDHALFVCYAPYDAPRYVVSVVVEHGGVARRQPRPLHKKL